MKLASCEEMPSIRKFFHLKNNDLTTVTWAQNVYNNRFFQGALEENVMMMEGSVTLEQRRHDPKNPIPTMYISTRKGKKIRKALGMTLQHLLEMVVDAKSVGVKLNFNQITVFKESIKVLQAMRKEWDQRVLIVYPGCAPCSLCLPPCLAGRQKPSHLTGGIRGAKEVRGEEGDTSGRVTLSCHHPYINKLSDSRAERERESSVLGSQPVRLGVDRRVQCVDQRVQCVDLRVQCVDLRVQCVDRCLCIAGHRSVSCAGQIKFPLWLNADTDDMEDKDIDKFLSLCTHNFPKATISIGMLHKGQKFGSEIGYDAKLVTQMKDTLTRNNDATFGKPERRIRSSS
uniref:Menorin-like domain-containing protein n=1 Tax=Timema cristinae TaxID=61476 RepID=A0A7R9DB19_TIMCR|nr:unnamed protein product [Timema cristinae]